jgi:integrase
MSKLYNGEIKERFLSNYDNEQTQATIRNVFAKTELVESVLEKDLYEMNLTELGKCIENTNPYNKNVAKSTGRFISQYLTFCTENGYRNSNINPLKGVDDEFYDKYVDKSKKIHFSFNEFLELLEDPILHNAQDKSFLFLIFEGLLGEQFSELRELKISDIDFENKTVYIKERGQKVEISDECIKYLEKTINEKTYYNYNPKTKDFNERELLQSVYVFKTTKSPRATEGQMVGMSMLYTRIHALKEILDLEYFTPNAIKQSGMIKMAVDIFKEEGVLGYDQLAKIGEKYNFSKLDNNGYSYYNTYLMKEFINEENIKELYGIDVVIQKR